ncbi:MAG TPA: hypothetical protein VFX59_04335 [Polyangiales bacterium]|nr:hypothetical protein [Polyangiales bacterium]
MHHALVFASLFLGLSCGGGNTTLPALGSVPPSSLCTDVKRCDVRGDTAVTTLAGTPIHLADKQGPESYLGKVAPKRVASSVLLTCGGEIVRDDWLETGPTARAVKVSDQGKQELRASLKNFLAQQLLAHPEVLEGRNATIESVIDASTQGTTPGVVNLVSQTYWLTDTAFEKRVGACGEENYADIIYSLTLLSLSDLTRKEIESKLLTNLSNKLAAAPSPKADEGEEAALEGAPEAAPAGDDEAQSSRLKELAFATVKALAGELRTIAALGFDER